MLSAMSSSMLVACAFLPLLSQAVPSHPFYLADSGPLLRPRIMTYYPDWAPLQSMDFSLFDIILFAFALPDINYKLTWETDQAPSLLENLVASAHDSSAKVSLSIGGWSGSRYFSAAVSTEPNRDIFANNIVDTLERYKLDGIDIDWEYPGQVGQPGNSESASDTANMLQFFKVLKQKLPPGALISAAVQDSTFAGPDGQPMKTVSAFSDFVDWITLMNYDTYGTRNPPGPNAPLSDACTNSSEPTQNAVTAYNAWTQAGFPANKIVLGVPGYGYIVESSVERLSSRSAFRAYSEDGSGQVQFKSLVSQGILTQNPDGSFNGSRGFTRGWDSCSATPYLRSDSAGQVISYDDTESLGIKAAWARNMNLLGVNLFDIHGDTPQYHLTHALRANLFPSPAQPTTPAGVSLIRTAILPSTAPSMISSSPNPHPPTQTGFASLPVILPGSALSLRAS